MKRILTTQNIDILAQFAWTRGFIAFDYDGTLAPISENRDVSTMRPRTRALLDRVAHLYPCAIIANRTRDDVVQRLDGIPIKHIVGNHGIESGESVDAFADEIAAVFPHLVEALQSVQGVDVENKHHSIAIHYHRARRKVTVRSALHVIIAEKAPALRVIPGKLVINLMPTSAPNKGDALVSLRKEEQADIALYVGDDVTDEDVFQLDEPGRLLCIRIGHSRRSAAPWYLRDQREIDLLLETLVDLRTKGQNP